MLVVEIFGGGFQHNPSNDNGGKLQVIDGEHVDVELVNNLRWSFKLPHDVREWE